MKSQNDNHDKAPASKTAGALEAPLTLQADQLELVAGGLAQSTIVSSALVLRPIINGLIRVNQ